MIHACLHCEFKSKYAWVVRRHADKKHAVQDQQFIPQQSFLQVGRGVGNQDTKVQDGTDTDDDDVVIESNPDSEEESNTESEEDEENLFDLLIKTRLRFNGLLNLRKKVIKVIPQVNELKGREQQNFLRLLAAFKADIIEERDGLDPEENGLNAEDEQDMEEDEYMCKGCQTDRIMDFVGDIEEIIKKDDKAVALFEMYFDQELKKRLKQKKKNESDTDDDNDDFDPSMDTTIKTIKEGTEHIKSVEEGFQRKGCKYFQHCSKSKIESMSVICKCILNDKKVKDAYQNYLPEHFEYVRETWKPMAAQIRKFSDPKVTLHQKRKVLQNPDVAEGIINGLTNLALPAFNNFLVN